MRPLLSILVLLLLPWSLQAQDTEDRRATLRGWQAIRVVVEDLEPEVERTGLLQKALQTDVELRLRQSGVLVRADASPYLYVRVTALSLSPGDWVFHAHVEFRQEVRPTGGQRRVSSYATTWHTPGVLGYVPSDRNMPERVRQEVRDQVDAFLNAWLSVNPR
jgi:hypothetical protein